MNLDHLPYLIAIASTGSLTAASRQLQISQPTLSCYLKNLEETLGMKLFFRYQRKYIPTPAGRRYLEAAQSMLEVLRHTHSSIRAPEQRDHLRIGLSPIWGINTLSDIYQELDNHYSHVAFHVYEGYAHELERRLKEGALDGVITSYSKQPPYGTNILPLTKSELVLAVPSFHPLVKHHTFSYPELPVADLHDFRDSVFIMPAPESSLYTMIQELFSTCNFHPAVTASTPHIRIQETLIRSGARVGLLPAYRVRPNSEIAFFRLQHSPVMILSYMTASNYSFSEVERFLLYLLIKHEENLDYNTVLWNRQLEDIVKEFDNRNTLVI